MPEYLNRTGGAAYLSSKLGRKVSKGSLEQHAMRGTGPQYVMVLGQASYTKEWLDAWIATLAEAPAIRPRPRSRRSTTTATANATL